MLLTTSDMKKGKRESGCRDVMGQIVSAMDVDMLSPVRTNSTSSTMSPSFSDSFPHHMKISKKSKLCKIIQRKACWAAHLRRQQDKGIKWDEDLRRKVWAPCGVLMNFTIAQRHLLMSCPVVTGCGITISRALRLQLNPSLSLIVVRGQQSRGLLLRSHIKVKHSCKSTRLSQHTGGRVTANMCTNQYNIQQSRDANAHAHAHTAVSVINSHINNRQMIKSIPL